MTGPRPMPGSPTPAARVLVVGDDPAVRRHVVAALVEHALSERRAGRPAPWPPNPDSLLVTGVDPNRLEPTRVDSAESSPQPPFVQLLTFDDVAAALHVDRRTVERLTSTGQLPVVHIGRAARVHPADLERLTERTT